MKKKYPLQEESTLKKQKLFYENEIKKYLNYLNNLTIEQYCIKKKNIDLFNEILKQQL